MSEKFIPGTNPEWERELPDNMKNSLVDKNGNSYDNGYNFDEFDREDEDNNEENPVVTPPNPEESDNKESE